MLGIGLASHVEYRPGKVFICVDNQASICTIGNPSSKSGQHIVHKIVEEIKKLREEYYIIELHWVPAHMGIAGNETAVKAAKEATGWRVKKTRREGIRELDTSSTAAQTPLVKELVSAKAAILRKRVLAEWKDKWSKETRGRELYKLEPEPKSNIVKLHVELCKELSSLVIQMRTGKIGIRQFLYERKVPGIEDGRCECRQRNQTVKHVLLNCRRYNTERQGLWAEESRKAQQKGGRNLDIVRILTEATSAKKAAIFMKSTGLTGRSCTYPKYRSILM